MGNTHTHVNFHMLNHSHHPHRHHHQLHHVPALVHVLPRPSHPLHSLIAPRRHPASTKTMDHHLPHPILTHPIMSDHLAVRPVKARLMPPHIHLLIVVPHRMRMIMMMTILMRLMRQTHIPHQPHPSIATIPTPVLTMVVEVEEVLALEATV